MFVASGVGVRGDDHDNARRGSGGEVVDNSALSLQTNSPPHFSFLLLSSLQTNSPLPYTPFPNKSDQSEQRNGYGGGGVVEVRCDEKR